VDVLDLKENVLRSLPVGAVLNTDTPALRYIAQVDEDGFLSPLRSALVDPDRLVITFDTFLRQTAFAGTMRSMLATLEEHYHSPVDTEFTAEIVDEIDGKPDVHITLLQCRPQSALDEALLPVLPADIPLADIVFATRRMVPRGAVYGIRYVVFVTPEGYFSLEPNDRTRLERSIGMLNTSLKDETFICVGPGRWGTSTPDLGVAIRYGDIYNTRALVELTGEGIAPDLQPSFGTHFFQDLMEANIYPLALTLGETGAVFSRDFFYKTTNHLTDLLPAEKTLLHSLRLVCVDDFRPGHSLSLVMDDDQNRAVAFLQPDGG
jgi:hypothetical protein